jgi:hypothetical protein
VDFTQTRGAQGVLFAIGDVTGGMVAYVEGGRSHLYYNGFGEFHDLVGPQVDDGRHHLVLEFEALGQRRGRGRLNLDGRQGEWGELSPTLMYGFHEGMDIGLDRRGPVKWDLKQKYGTFRYDGAIHEVVVETGPFAPDTGYAKG